MIVEEEEEASSGEGEEEIEAEETDEEMDVLTSDKAATTKRYATWRYSEECCWFLIS